MKTKSSKLELMEQLAIARRKKGELHIRGKSLKDIDELIRRIEVEKEKLFCKPPIMEYKNKESKPY